MTDRSDPRSPARTLGALTGHDLEPAVAARPIRDVTANSADVRDGSIFVALRGTRVDGHDFVGDAVERGASALVVEEDPGERTEPPVLVVPDSRQALAEIAARWHGCPAERLSLVGITGTVGKTSTLAMLDSILQRAGVEVAGVGSLGVFVNGHCLEETGYTSPDPLLLHEKLAEIERRGCSLVAMEVTSHALTQERVHGLRYSLGVFANLVPLEHSEYHSSFRGYVEAKSRFFSHMKPGAPLVFNADDPAVRRLVRQNPVEPVSCGRSPRAAVRVESEETSADGTRLELNVRHPLPMLGGATVRPTRIPVRLRLLGRSNVANAALAATTALCLGADPESIQDTLAGFESPPRRMEFVHAGNFSVLDDTVGHPDSISALFEVIRSLAPRRVHLVFGVRGRRGVRINRQNAEALAIWTRKVPVETLAITPSVEAADERNRVSSQERDAFVERLTARGVPFIDHERLDHAVHAALDAAGEGDLVVLAGAQGMDQGREVVRRWIEERGSGRP